MAEPSATRASTRKRSRRSESLGSAKKNRVTKAQGTKAPRSQLQQDRLSLGTSCALRDRILQHQDADGVVPKNLQPTLQDVRKQIVDLERKITRKATAADVRAHACPTPLCPTISYMHVCCHQVYKVLDDEFEDCPWPVPPSAIMKFVPIPEDPTGKPKRRNNEAVLRDILGRDKRFKNISQWEFRDASRPQRT